LKDYIKHEEGTKGEAETPLGNQLLQVTKATGKTPLHYIFM
jgi:hypothetical protein